MVAADRPNILFFHVDNLGFGELSCYSGGPFRGATTDRIDAFAAEGFRLTNYCPESQCTPTRSALLTGRHAIRSGTHSVPIGSTGGWGLVAWERTLGELLAEAGYTCAAYGKWHVGEGAGRWPTDRGFEEWYGPPRTYEEALWPNDPWYDPSAIRSPTCIPAATGESQLPEATPERRRRVRRWGLMIALGSFLFGYDTGIISGTLLFMKEDFDLNAAEQILGRTCRIAARG